MSKVVFVLGAGASAHAEAPLMKDFLDRAEDVLNQGKLEASEQSDFQLVFNALHQLSAAQAKGYVNTQNMESVFSAFELAGITGRFAGLAAGDISRLPQAMRTVIRVTLEERVRFSVVDQQPRPPTGYQQLAELVKDVRRAGRGWPTIITFNYDICPEFGLYAAGIPFDYRLSLGAEKDWVRLLKLHGSLNWVRCRACGRIVEYSFAKHVQVMYYGELPSHLPLPIAGDALRSAACGCDRPSPEIMIVPPTWDKSQYHALLMPVWRAAANELADAVSVVVCGYSLPETDSFFRNLYSLGSIGPARLRHFLVYDIGGSSVETRFRKLLGPDSEPRFIFHSSRFEDGALNSVRGYLLRET